MSKVTEIVTELITPFIARLGVELWDVEYIKIGGEQYLRILIDSENGVFVDQCEAVSKAIDPLLDEANVIDTSYILEVASAGIERSLKKPEHFARYIGSLIEVRMYKALDGQKRYVGILRSYDDRGITIEVGVPEPTAAKGATAAKELTDPTELTIPLENISKASLKFNWQ